jgi:hypothetical protein
MKGVARAWVHMASEGSTAATSSPRAANDAALRPAPARMSRIVAPGTRRDYEAMHGLLRMRAYRT